MILKDGEQRATNCASGAVERVDWNVAVVGLYDVYYRDKDDKGGAAQAAAMPGTNAYDYYRKDVGVGARWDINDYWLIKAEYHKVVGADLLLQNFNNNMAVKNWDYYTIKTSFNF